MVAQFYRSLYNLVLPIVLEHFHANLFYSNTSFTFLFAVYSVRFARHTYSTVPRTQCIALHVLHWFSDHECSTWLLMMISVNFNFSQFVYSEKGRRKQNPENIKTNYLISTPVASLLTDPDETSGLRTAGN